MIKSSKEYKKTTTLFTVTGASCTKLSKTQKCFDRIMKLHADNRKLFRKIFGKPHFYYRGEFYFHCWSLMFKGENYIIFTAKTKGTTYEVVRDTIKLYKETGKVEKPVDKQFIKYILKLINKNQ